jgi:hypothetical protein
LYKQVYEENKQFRGITKTNWFLFLYSADQTKIKFALCVSEHRHNYYLYFLIT